MSPPVKLKALPMLEVTIRGPEEVQRTLALCAEAIDRVGWPEDSPEAPGGYVVVVFKRRHHPNWILETER